MTALFCAKKSWSMFHLWTFRAFSAELLEQSECSYANGNSAETIRT